MMAKHCILNQCVLIELWEISKPGSEKIGKKCGHPLHWNTLVVSHGSEFRRHCFENFAVVSFTWWSLEFTIMCIIAPSLRLPIGK